MIRCSPSSVVRHPFSGCDKANPCRCGGAFLFSIRLPLRAKAGGGAGPIPEPRLFSPNRPGTRGFPGVYSAPGRAGEAALAVIIPFESVAPISIDRLLDPVAADMARV